MTHALVTGGAGFIGSHLVDALLAGGHTVRVLDDLSTGSSDNVAPGAELVVGSVVDEACVGEATRGVEVVFHQAAHRSVPRSLVDPLGTDAVNTHGTLVVLTAAAAAGVRRVVYASSSSAYGDSAALPSTESAAPAPRSPYAVSKLAGEMYCRVFSGITPLETVSLRYFNVFGPRQHPDSPYAAVIPLFAAALLGGEPPVVHGDGLQTRDFTFVDDAVAANLAAAAAPPERCSGHTYNVAGGRPYSLLDLLAHLEDLTGKKADPVHTDPRPGDVRHTHADLAAATRDLDWKPAVDLGEGLARTMDWLTRPAPPS